MSENEWLTCDDPVKMCKFGRDQISDRQRKQFIQACLPIKNRSINAPDLLREIVGNPFRPYVWEGSHIIGMTCKEPHKDCRDPYIAISDATMKHNDGAIPTIAKMTYDVGLYNTVSMLILADMLEEAGCAEAAILEHLRKERDGEPCAWCRGRGDIMPNEPYPMPELCQKCNGTGRRKTPHASGCFVLALLIGEKT